MAWALLEIVVPLILAVLLGILIGWFLWRWRRTKVTHTEWASMQMRANSGERSAMEIQGLTGDLEGRDADLAACRSRVAELEAELEAAKADGGGAAALAAGAAGAAGGAAVASSDDGDGDADADADAGSADGDAASDAGAADATASDAAAGGDAGDHEIQGLTGAAAADAVAPEASADDADSGDAAADDAASADDAATDDAADADAVVGGDRHPYGEGSHAPFEADAKVMPDGYEIKGNADSMLYHRPDSRVYGATIAEVWFDTPERAEAAGFTLAGSHPKDTSADDAADERAVVGGERHPYGEGSHAPFDGAEKDMPEGYPIKGNADSMLYHREDSRSYKATIAEVWFDTPERAEAAGFGLANSHPKD